MSRPRKHDSLFNPDRKEAYIAFSPASARGVNRTLFHTTFELETRLNTDICKIPEEDVRDLFNREFGLKASTVKVFLLSLNKYINWCVCTGLESDLKTHKFDFDFIYKSRKYLVASPAHMSAVLDKVFSPIDSHTIDCVTRGYVWLIYMGLTQEEAIDLTTDDVDLDSMTIRYRDFMIRILPEAYKTIELLCKLTHFRHNRIDFPGEVARIEGNKILRGWKKSVNSKFAIRERLVSINDDDTIRFAVNYAYLSGVYYRIMEFERMNGCPNFTQIAREYIKYQLRKKAKETSGHDLKRQIDMARRDLESGYSWWKKAYWPQFVDEDTWSQFITESKNNNKKQNVVQRNTRFACEPENWSDVYARWKNGEISGRAAARELGMSAGTFLIYAKGKPFKKSMSDT